MRRDVCERCMAEERVASYESGEQVGKPVPWQDEDSWAWEHGKVRCPHLRIDVFQDRALGSCLRRGQQELCLVVDP